MIHVISSENRPFYADVVEEHFRIRHEIFVSERGWTALRRADGREVDAYDNEDTVYLLALDGERVVGGHRLYPTVKPTMISEIFPHLASVCGVPSDPAIWEWSRYFVVRGHRDGRLNLQLMAAVQEYCVNAGITQVSAVMETWWLPRFQEAGFVVHPLGLPALVEGSWAMAALIDMNEETLEHVQQLGGICGSVLGPHNSLDTMAATSRARVFEGSSQ